MSTRSRAAKRPRTQTAPAHSSSGVLLGGVSGDDAVYDPNVSKARQPVRAFTLPRTAEVHEKLAQMQQAAALKQAAAELRAKQMEKWAFGAMSAAPGESFRGGSSARTAK